MRCHLTQHSRQVYWPANHLAAHRRPSPCCAAAPDVPDTSQRHLSKRPKPGPRQRSRAPVQPQAPPPIERDFTDNIFLDPGQFDFQQQMKVMQEAFSQMSDSERKAFLEYLASQEALAAREAPSSPHSKPERRQAQGPRQQDSTTYSASLREAEDSRGKLLSEVWGYMLDSLPKRDAAILTKVLPRGWNGARDLSRRDIMEGFSRLTRAELRRLPWVLKQVDQLQATAGAMAEVFEQESRLKATRRRRLAAQKGLTFAEVAEEGDEQDKDESADGETAGVAMAPPTNLSDLLGVVQRQLRDQLRTIEAQEELPLREEDHPLQRVRLGPQELYDTEYYHEPFSVTDRQQQPGASTSGSKNSSSHGSTSGNSGGGNDAIPEALQGRLGRMAAAYDTYVSRQGWEVEASRRESSEMRNLMRLHVELSELVAAAAGPPRGPSGMPLTGRAAAVYDLELQQSSEDLAAQVAALLQPEEKRRLQDPAARSVVRYIETQLVATEPGFGTGEREWEADLNGVALDLDEQSVTRLGQFMRAAVNWEAYRAFLEIYAARNPELNLRTAMRAAGMSDGDEWWVKMPEYDFGGNGSDAAGGGGDDGGGSPLRPQVDWSRVEAVAALDVDSLAFLTELEATRYSEDTFMKWYFHPVMGPRIRSGSLLDPAAAGRGQTPAAAAAGGTGDEGTSGPGAASLDPAALLTQLLGGLGGSGD
ncbi:hypothetical protein VaNZ11_014049, partial [Volvox africanus]